MLETQTAKQMSTEESLQVGLPIVILAAGKGSRMRSQTPKVLQNLAGKPLLFHLLNEIKKINKSTQVSFPVGLVVGACAEEVQHYLSQEKEFFKTLEIDFILQKQPQGTGHALQCVLQSPWGQRLLKQNTSFLVLPGDFPLLPASLVSAMAEPLNANAVMRVLTCTLKEPKGYGRVLRAEGSQAIVRIVEEKDATPSQKQIKEVAHSIYLFQAQFLEKHLSLLTAQNAQAEYYLTDMIALASARALQVEELKWGEPEDLRGVNNTWELAQAGRIFNQRLLERLALEKGILFQDPSSTWIDVTVELAEGITIEPGVILRGETRVGAFSKLGPYVFLKDAKLAQEVELAYGSVAEGVEIERGASVGPFTRLRPGTKLAAQTRIGSFVELKATEVGEGSKVPHLSYLGDASLGKRVNIGCGFITCNYDGTNKHSTIIGDDVFVGGGSQVVAPIHLAEGSFVAAGSTLTEGVGAGEMAVARARQVNKPDYAKKIRKKKPKPS